MHNRNGIIACINTIAFRGDTAYTTDSRYRQLYLHTMHIMCICIYHYERLYIFNGSSFTFWV